MVARLAGVVVLWLSLVAWAEPAPAPSVRAQPRPPFALDVFVDSTHTGAIRQVHTRARDILNRANLAAPPDRVVYFESLLNPITRPIEGWSGLIESVQPTPGGVVVDLRIYTVQPGMGNMLHRNERYAIIGTQVHYVGSSVPEQISLFQFTF